MTGILGLGGAQADGGKKHGAKGAFVTFDDEGLSTNFHATETQALAWTAISGIFLLRTSLGPFQKNTFWCFASEQVELILSVPAEAEGLETLAEELPKRFCGIDFSDLQDRVAEPVVHLWGDIPEVD